MSIYNKNIDTITQYFDVSDSNKHIYGEVNTDFILINKMLDLLPETVFKDKNKKWLDPCCGKGYFSIVLYQRLFKSLPITDPIERHSHIIEKMIYMIEINGEHLNELYKLFGEKANILNGDFLDLTNQKYDAKDKAKKLISQLERRLDYLETERSLQGVHSRQQVLSPKGLATLCSGGGWLPDIKCKAGCEDALNNTGGCPPRILTWEQISEADPNILLILPCSASSQRTMDKLHLLASAPEFWALRCVKGGDVYILDHAKFSRPGPRLVNDAEMLAALL